MARTRKMWTGRTATGERERISTVRGGVSIGGILTGVVVAFGSSLLLSALIGGALTGSDLDAGEVAEQGGTDVGIGLGASMVAVFLVSYLWGGYTAGRMGRGAGAINGFLVALVAGILGAVVVAIVNQYNVTANLNLPYTEGRLTADQESVLYDWGATVGAGMIVAAFVGGILGGMLGSRWHTKLERRAIDELEAERESEIAQAREAELARERERRREAEAERRKVDLRERETVNRTSGRPGAPTR